MAKYEILNNCQQQQHDSCSASESINLLALQNEELQTEKSQYESDLLISSVILFIIFVLVIKTNARHS